MPKILYVQLPPRTSSSTLRQFFAITDALEKSGKQISRENHVTSVSVSRWRHGKSAPDILDMESLAASVDHRVLLVPNGYKVQLVPDDV